MSCPIPRPDPQTLFNQILSNFQAKVLGGASVVPESNEWYVVSLDYAQAEEFYSIAAQQWAETDPRTACCDNLAKIAAYDGVFPYAAGFAQGYVQITGTPGASLPNPVQVSINGNNYVAVGTYATVIPVEGSVTVRVKAIVPGTASNAATGSGSLANPTTGISQTVTVYGSGFCGGTDAEDCETFRARYLQRKTFQPRATQSWMQQKLLEWPCATRAIPRDCGCTDKNCSCNTCQGNVDFYLMFDNTFPCGIAPNSIITDVNTWMFGSPAGSGLGQVEVGVCGQIYAPKPLMVDANINGLACIDSGSQAEITAAVQNLFANAVPSKLLTQRTLELLIAQIVGPNTEVLVSFQIISPTTGGGNITACGDLLPECDYMPCLRNVNFGGPVSLFDNLVS